ncbi:MAG: hypothetical protein ABIL72_07635, partial [candidate division WOR-3 bacterium]
NGFSGFATSYGIYGYSANFNIFNKPNYNLNVGITNIIYRNNTSSYLNFNFNYNKNSFSIQVIGSFPLNYNFNYVPNFR